MPPVDSKQLSSRLSKRLANFKLPDATIKQLSDRMLIDGLSIGKIDPCIYGICIDYFSDTMPRLEDLSAKRRVAKWEVFPYGIIDWDRFLVRVAYEVDELEGRGSMRGFMR